MRAARILVAVGLLAAAAAPAAAQERVWVRDGGTAWLGISYETEWLQRGDGCEARVIVEHVVQGSPAERAGLRPGDAILAMDGQSVGETGLPTAAARLAPGDAVRLEIARDGRTRELVAVADRRPDRVPSLFIFRRSGLDATTAPVVRVRGDTVMARNLERAGALPGARGYWLAGDGGTEYRRLRGAGQDGLDRRVATLLECVEEERGGRWLELRNVQQRADSLRLRIVERALQRRDEDETRLHVELGDRGEVTIVEQLRSPAGVVTFDERGPGGYVLRVEDQLLAGLRGVAGAELTPLEPELAEYFRNAGEGLLVLRVSHGTPAGRAGLRPGDVVRRADGRSLDTVDELRQLLARPDAAAIELEVVRKGRSLTVTLPRR